MEREVVEEGKRRRQGKKRAGLVGPYVVRPEWTSTLSLGVNKQDLFNNPSYLISSLDLFFFWNIRG